MLSYMAHVPADLFLFWLWSKGNRMFRHILDIVSFICERDFSEIAGVFMLLCSSGIFPISKTK